MSGLRIYGPFIQEFENKWKKEGWMFIKNIVSVGYFFNTHTCGNKIHARECIIKARETNFG